MICLQQTWFGSLCLDQAVTDILCLQQPEVSRLCLDQEVTSVLCLQPQFGRLSLD